MKNSKKSKLVIVSNRLPFYKEKTASGRTTWKQATGGLVTALDPVLRQTGGTWLGWDGSYQKAPKKTSLKLTDIGKFSDKDHPENDNNSYTIGNVPISEAEADLYYNQFSNSVIWALFHYFFEKSQINYEAWNTYAQINWRFAQYIEAASSPKDTIWVQDFHLFLVPFFLRKLRPKQKIHFFLHIPFPHFDIFSIIPWHDQIIESLLCCNTVGFHHNGYLKNAKQAVALYRAKNKKNKISALSDEIDSHFYVNPISINFKSFHNTSRLTEVVQRRNEIKSSANAPKVILGVDRLDYSKGIKERLLAIEHLLINRPELKEQFCYFQLAVPSRENITAYMELKKEVDYIVGRINGSFSTGTWYPIHYVYNAIPFKELVALYLAADIGLVTPLRDGMNLVCKEYIACHSDEDGVLILSKFAGAISEIKNCLPVNPYSIEDIANAVYTAIKMPLKDRKQRMKRMRKNISSHNIDLWLAKCFDYFKKNA